MRLSRLRVPAVALLTALFAALVVSDGPGVRGQGVKPGIRIKDKKGDDKDAKDDKDKALDDLENAPFSIPSDRDAKNQLTAAREYLAFNEIPWNTVCPLLQNILESKSDSFFNVPYTSGGVKMVNHISVKTEANRIIAAFRPEGLQFYQQLYGQTASALLDDAIRANYDLPLLADLSQKYFHTRAGAEATVLLATIYLERGNYLEAAHNFERLLNRPNTDDVLTPRTLFKACLALHRSGDPRHAELYKTALVALQKATLRDGLAVGRKKYTFDQLKQEIERPLELIRVSTAVGEWALRGGNPARSGTVDGGPPFLAPNFRSPMLTGDPADDGIAWIRTELEKLFDRGKNTKTTPLPAFFPVATADSVIYRTYRGVECVASRDHMVNGRVVRGGEQQWESKSSSGVMQLMSTSQDPTNLHLKQNVSAWWTTYSQTNVQSILYENPLIGTLSHDGQNVYFIDDIAIPPPPIFAAPEFGIMPQGQPVQSGDLGDLIRGGRLVAVNMRSGNEVWELGRVKVWQPEKDQPPPPPLPNTLNEDEADKTTSAFHLCLDAIFLGTPLPLNGNLYVLIEQAGVVRLVCLDPKNLVAVPGQTKKPALVWSQKLGRPNTSLPQDSIRRFQGASLAASDGIIVCPTNSGVIVAVDIMSHSLLWAHSYKDATQAEPKRVMYSNDGRLILPQQLSNERWRASGPIIANGRVLVTAWDSKKLECLDLRTGKKLWSTQRLTDDLYVGGVVNDVVVVVGRDQVRGYRLTGEEGLSPKVAFDPVKISTPTGHGIGAKGVYYIPVRQETAGSGSTPAAEIWAINVENGQIVSKTGARKRNDNTELTRFGIGNLVFQDGLVFAQSGWELACYPQLEQKKAEMDRLLKANPKDPVGLLNRGELLLDDGKLKEAISDFAEAEKNKLPDERVPQLREKKYIAYTELLRTDFAEGEKYLDEYKRLCELPAEPNEGPEEKVRREDEMNRRQRWRQYLLARGRESQGRLGEAFDHYVALANLGDAKNLEEMPDEPNVRMRPDVWARGRIESMIRKATDPAARKSLDARIKLEWDAVKSGNDLKRLREFVSIFGPYFATGAEAQFLLVDKLLQTNNEADVREAQTYLAQLRVTGETPEVRARAIEALARLMTANQLMEDAVGLYQQLGKEYPNIVVRDGKTGADFLIDLLTDKRLLPYLEPSRYPMPTRVKAERREGATGMMYGMAQFEVVPTGELFPMYRRFRYLVDLTGNGTWTVKAVDRATGAVVRHFPGLNPPQTFNPGSIPFSNFVQGNGQLLLVQFGAWIYCLDLAEKKERWQKNLLGDSANGNQQIQGPDADGEVTVRSEDGYIFTLGRAAVLEAGYAAILTHEGLEVIEPLTKRQLWTRKGIQMRTQIYGDARHLVLVEMDASKKSLSTKTLRVVDGMPVEGNVNLGPTLEAARSYLIHGTTVLVTEGKPDAPRVLRLLDLVTGKELWKKEYDAKAAPIKSLDREWCGFINPNGTAEVIEVRTGRVAARLKIDEKHLASDLQPCGVAQLFHDADRFYLVLDRKTELPSTNGTVRQPIFNNTIRSHAINGPMYAFDRATGKRLWYFGDGLLENQMLILEQFADLPVIIVAGPMTNPQARQVEYPVLVIEKARGKLILETKVPYNGQFFQTLNVNVKSGIVEMSRFDVTLRIFADESAKGDAP